MAAPPDLGLYLSQLSGLGTSPAARHIHTIANTTFIAQTVPLVRRMERALAMHRLYPGDLGNEGNTWSMSFQDRAHSRVGTVELIEVRTEEYKNPLGLVSMSLTINHRDDGFVHFSSVLPVLPLAANTAAELDFTARVAKMMLTVRQRMLLQHGEKFDNFVITDVPQRQRSATPPEHDPSFAPRVNAKSLFRARAAAFDLYEAKGRRGELDANAIQAFAVAAEFLPARKLHDALRRQAHSSDDNRPPSTSWVSDIGVAANLIQQNSVISGTQELCRVLRNNKFALSRDSEERRAVLSTVAAAVENLTIKGQHQLATTVAMCLAKGASARTEKDATVGDAYGSPGNLAVAIVADLRAAGARRPAQMVDTTLKTSVAGVHVDLE